MAKALLGHLGGQDPHLLAEISRLRRRVATLEHEAEALRTANAELRAVRRDGGFERVLVEDRPVAEPVGV